MAITPNPELARVNAARRSMMALRLEVPKAVWDDVNAKVEALCVDVLSFDARHVLHQQEQRDSAARLTAALDETVTPVGSIFPRPEE